MLVFVVLMQRPRSEGLGSAFGGGITDNVFGSQTSNVLAKFTTWMAIGFFGITLLLSVLTVKATSGKTAVQEKLLSSPVPTATPEAAATPEVATTPEVAPVATPAQPTPEAIQEEVTLPAVMESSPAETTPVLEAATDQASSIGIESVTESAQPVTEEAVVETPQPEAPLPQAN
jgi:preprotein translocase subunit SecG